jgi:hypothetical protein
MSTGCAPAEPGAASRAEPSKSIETYRALLIQTPFIL